MNPLDLFSIAKIIQSCLDVSQTEENETHGIGETVDKQSRGQSQARPKESHRLPQTAIIRRQTSES